MHYVSLIIELLRGRPALMFWSAALTQAALWAVVPSLFYSAPPGDVPLLLAIGHEFQLGSYLGPPLAFWLGEVAYRAAGAPGVYVLAQVCIVVAYWAVFALGRGIVGTRHAVLAVLLMVGVAAFTAPSPDFGPAVLAAPLWALALLHYWRAVGDGRRGYWFLLAFDLGLLLLTSYAGVILAVLMAVFTLATAPGRRALAFPEPWLALLLTFIVVAPHLWWLYDMHPLVLSGFEDGVAASGVSPGLRLLSMLVAAVLGLLLLVALASGRPRKPRARAPEIDRAPVTRLARTFVYVFALVPAIVAVALATAFGRLGPLSAYAPLLLLAGLAVIVAAGDRVPLYRERLVSMTWLALMLLPPVLVVLGISVLPWVSSIDPKVMQPARAQGRFFAETFERRTGVPLKYVSGDPRIAPLVALAAPSRPHVYFVWAPERSPWATADDLRRDGAVLVWPANDNRGAPPADLKAQFPELVPEVPRSFARTMQGFLPLIRLGWSVIRPQAQ